MAVVLEVQLKPIERKRQTWPAYFATTHSRLKCPVALLVFCPTEAVADWVADPIRIGDPGMVLTAIALGPSQIPKVTTLEQAETYPELAIMSVLAHGNGSDPEPVLSVLPAVLNKFDLEHAQLYARLVAGALRAAAQACLEEIVTTAAGQDEKFLGELLFPTTFARGRAEGKVQAVLGILAARGVSVSDEVHARITACTDDEELDRWVHRAVVADRAEELFA